MIFASAFILYSLIFGVENARSVISFNLLRFVSASGLLLYIGVGIAALISGGNFLDYNVLLADPVHGQHLGILVIEFGVGMTVAAVMMMIFFVFARP